MHKIIFIIILTSIHLPDFAQIRVTIKTPERVIAGATFDVIIESNKNIKLMRPEMQNFKYLNIGTAQSANVYNNQVMNNYSYILTYICDIKPGKYTFPSIKVTYKSDTFYTEAKNIEIVAKDTSLNENLDESTMLPYVKKITDIKIDTDIISTITPNKYVVKKDDILEIKLTTYNGLSNNFKILNLSNNSIILNEQKTKNMNPFQMVNVYRTSKSNEITRIKNRNYRVDTYSIEIRLNKTGVYKIKDVGVIGNILSPDNTIEMYDDELSNIEGILMHLPEITIKVVK